MTKEQEIEKRIRSTAELLGIGTLLQRKPDQLSGGQRQRVALGRAIIRKPKVFLLDEPLSNLDAKLRTSMRAEIAELQRKLKITTVYVTHDQTEAMTLGQRIVVLNDGVVEQIGSPREVYSKPSNVFVASFIGNPPMNLIRGVLETKGSRPFAFVYDDNQGIRLSEKLELTRIPDNSRKEVVLGIRPEHLKVAKGTDSVQSAEGSAANMFIGVVVHVESLGNITYIHLKIGEHTKIILSFEGYSQFDIGNELHVEFSPDDVHFFDSETGTRI